MTYKCTDFSVNSGLQHRHATIQKPADIHDMLVYPSTLRLHAFYSRYKTHKLIHQMYDLRRNKDQHSAVGVATHQPTDVYESIVTLCCCV